MQLTRRPRPPAPRAEASGTSAPGSRRRGGWQQAVRPSHPPRWSSRGVGRRTLGDAPAPRGLPPRERDWACALRNFVPQTCLKRRSRTGCGGESRATTEEPETADDLRFPALTRVEVMGIEPTASSMRPKRSSQLSYTPVREGGGYRLAVRASTRERRAASTAPPSSSRRRGCAPGRRAGRRPCDGGRR